MRVLAKAGLLCALFAAAHPAFAQISPGQLSRSHAALEGSGQCLKCHDAQHGVAPQKCLACHTALNARIAAGRGLHAQADYRSCKTCHVEHQGREYDLVWWGKTGRASFDHQLAGWKLEGRHAASTCEQCHVAAHQQNRASFQNAGVNVQRTFLGLSSTCTPCHTDAHRGQFDGRACTDCHQQSAWRPAPGFDHGRTTFPLTGRHATARCALCHKSQASDAAGSYPVYRGTQVPHECAACHPDTHRGRLGADCAGCHDTSGWQRTPRARVDHDRTAYPLRGRHAGLACEKCHAPGRPVHMKHAACTDCHADAHFGQLAPRPDRGRCEACHDVAGFTPTRFAPEDHQATAYPLAGAHRAVACQSCHRRVSLAGLRSAGVKVPAGASVRESTQLHFSSFACAACHRDPHAGSVDRWMAKRGCEACHSVDSWRAVRFDHARTQYALVGGHAKAACGACHKKVEVGTPRERLRFSGTGKTCATCHADPHRGQFSRGAVTDCGRCHAAETLKASLFDHARDSAYVLKGAHARLACAACHKPESAEGVTLVRYKPLPTACKDCHARRALAGSGTER